MRRIFLAIAITAAAFLAVEPASAQGRLPNIYRTVPKARKVAPVVILPKVIPPSTALRAALGHMPNAKPLGVKINKQGIYIVKLKQGNTISQVRVNGATGVILP